MVEQIECQHLKLRVEAFGDAGVFENGHVHGIDGLTTLSVTVHSEEGRTEELGSVHVKSVACSAMKAVHFSPATKLRSARYCQVSTYCDLMAFPISRRMSAA